MDPEPSAPKKQKPYNTYLKYSGLGFQFLMVIGVATFGGYKLDQYLSLRFPAFTLLFSFLALIGMLYKLYQAITNM